MKRVFLILLFLIILVPQGYGQDFVPKYENMSPKDVKAFVKDWYLWSRQQPSREPSTAVDTLLCKAFDKQYRKVKQKYFVFPNSIVVWYHKDDFKILTLDSLSVLLPPPPPPGMISHDVYNVLDHKEIITPPYKIRKKALYLTPDIAGVINTFRSNYDILADWKATKRLKQYIKIGSYGEIRTAPVIIQIYVYPNGYVVPYDLGGRGGSDFFSLDLEEQSRVSSWIH